MPKPSHDVTYHWKHGEKTGWTTIGHAFTNDNGSITIHLMALPHPSRESNPGTLTLFPKKSAKEED